jgi:hypothetical protein
VLPFGVDRIEQRRALQRNAAKPYLRKFSLLSNLPGECKLAEMNRRFPDPLSPKNFAGYATQNTEHPTPKNEPFSQGESIVSNRFWVKNRSYRKQTIKPLLTGSRIASGDFTKLPHFRPRKPARIPSSRAKITKHSLLLSPRNFIGLQDRDCRSVRLTVSAQK